MYLNSFLTNTGMVMIIAQFPDVDQFQWTAWLQVIAGGIVLLLCTLFRDSHQMCSKRCCASKKKNSSADVQTMAGATTKECQPDHVHKRTPPVVIFVSSFCSHTLKLSKHVLYDITKPSTQVKWAV